MLSVVSLMYANFILEVQLNNRSSDVYLATKTTSIQRFSKLKKVRTNIATVHFGLEFAIEIKLSD